MMIKRLGTSPDRSQYSSGPRGRWLLAVAAMSSSLGACSTIDEVGPRSARYNVAAVESRSRSILTNVIRAAYGKPLQFTDLTTATGQATLSGEVGLGLPFEVNPVGTARTFTASPKIGGSGTSSFNVVSLNSKEFYQGLQTPISVQQIANFIAAGYDPQLLLFLIVSDLEIRSPTTRTTFHSDADSEHNYRQFYQAIAFLREAGLSTRPGKPSAFGPFLSAKDISDPEVIATLLSTASGPLSLKEDPAGANTYRFYRGGSYEFCFDPIRVNKTAFQNQIAVVEPGLSLRTMATSGNPEPIKGALVIKGAEAVKGTSFVIDPASFCNPPEGADETGKTKILISARSVEGIFQFLGQIARRQLELQGSTAQAPAAQAPVAQAPVVPGQVVPGQVVPGQVVPGPRADQILAVQSSDGKRIVYPFRVVAGVPEKAALTIEEEGRSFSIVTDAAGTEDQTTRVFQLLTDLLALQSSAKDLPAPNVISIVGR